MAHKKSRDVLNEIPVCPRCQKPTHRSCESQDVRSNKIYSTWKCEGCNGKFTANIDLDSEDEFGSVNDLVKPLDS